MSDLMELAERCEKASGPDRELDCAIYNAAPDGENRKAERLPMEKWGDRFDDGWRTMWADREDKYCEPLKRYTASLDAAMTLVGDGCFECGNLEGAWARVIDGSKNGFFAEATTPALALCAAALRSLSTPSMKDVDDDD